MGVHDSCMVLTLGEAALLLKVGKKTLYRLAREGRVPARKVGREWRFVESVLADWLVAFDRDQRRCWEVKGCKSEVRETCPCYPFSRRVEFASAQ